MADHVIPELPVLIPLAGVVLLAQVWHLHRRRTLNPIRLGLAVVTAVYVAGVVWQVFFPFPIRVGSERDGMASWHARIQLVPFYDHEPSTYVLNVLLFVPLGVLLPLVTRVRSVWGAVLVGFLASLAIETLQFVLAGTVTSGHIAEVDDLMANTLGALVGWLLLKAARRTLGAGWVCAGPTPEREGPRLRS